MPSPAPQAEASALEVLQLVTGDFQENCYLAWAAGAQEAVLLDPGDEPERIGAALALRTLRPAAFLLTHCHLDHIGALTPLKERFPEAPIHVPEAEKDWLTDSLLNMSILVGRPVTGPPADAVVRDGDTLSVAGLSLRAIHVPGHSPGGTAYLVTDPRGGPGHLFCGDILFQGSIGRTDFPGCQGEEVLVEGIRSKLFPLPDSTIVHPGHGPRTTIGEERRNNPFCGERNTSRRRR